MYLKQPMSLGRIMLQLPCGLHYMVQLMLLSLWNVLCFYINTSQSMCALPSTVVFRSFLTSRFQAVIFNKIMAKNYPSTAEVYTSAKMEGLSVENLARSQIYRGIDKSLARPGKKQATATEDFEFHISYS